MKTVLGFLPITSKYTVLECLLLSFESFCMLYQVLKNAFLAVFFPELCLHCEKKLLDNEKDLCTACLLNLPKYNHDLLKDRFLHLKKLSFIEAFFLYTKNGIGQHIIHDIKYHGNAALGVRIGYSFAQSVLERGKLDFDFLIPVPIHQAKRKQRGFNQSEAIAEGMSKVLKLPVMSGLVSRVINSNSQSKSSKLTRLISLEGVFEISEQGKETLPGKRILLVDDVVTTGATISALVYLLEDCDIAEVAVLSLAAAAKN